MNKEIERMYDVVKNLAIENRESIYQETTLAGTGQAFINLIAKTHQKGYEVTAFYVNLDSPCQTKIRRTNKSSLNHNESADNGAVALHFLCF